MEDFSVAKSEDYFKYLYTYISSYFQLENEEEGLEAPYILINSVKYPCVFIFLSFMYLLVSF